MTYIERYLCIELLIAIGAVVEVVPERVFNILTIPYVMHVLMNNQGVADEVGGTLVT